MDRSRLADSANGAVKAAPEVDCARPGDDVAHTVSETGLRQDRRTRRAVADHVAGALRGLTRHLGAEILLGVLEFELLGKGDAVVADQRRGPFPLDQN